MREVDASPLFILSPPRSFTSITCAMIGQHPAMYGLPEVNLFAAETYADFQRLITLFRPRLGHGLLRAVAELGLGNQSSADIDAAQAWLEENHSSTTADLFRALMEWASPRRLVDKSPIYVTREEFLQRIDRGFPNARYLHLLRHPRSNLQSVRNRNVELQAREAGRLNIGGNFKKDGQRFFKSVDSDEESNVWLRTHERIVVFLDGVEGDRWQRIRGEDLLARPEEHLPRIAEWLGISTDTASIAAMLRPEQSRFAMVGPENAPGGNDPGFLKQPKLRRYTRKPLNLEDPLSWSPESTLSEELKDLARGFGYR